MAQECLDQATVALILGLQSLVLLTEDVALLCLHGHLAFKLANVFCGNVSKLCHNVIALELTLSSRAEGASRDLVPQLPALLAGQLLALL